MVGNILIGIFKSRISGKENHRMLISEATFESILFNIICKLENLENKDAKLPMEIVAVSRSMVHDNG